MKKKLIGMLLTSTILTGVLTPTAFAENNRYIKLIVGGEKIETKVAPILVNDRTMLPLRAVFEAIGAKVKYDSETRTVTSTKNGHTVKMTVNSDIMLVDGKEVKLDVAPFIKNDRTLIPVRACAEAFDMEVEWIDRASTVKVKTKVSVPVESSSSEGYSVKYTYDENGNCIYEEFSDGQWTKYEYDELYNLLFMENSIGYLIKNTYNEQGIIVSTEGKGDDWTDVKYDESGNIIYETDGYNYVENKYDELNRLICSEGERDGEKFRDIYTYDENGNLISEETLYGTIKYTYDLNGNCISKEGNNFKEKSTYNEDGQIIMYENSNYSPVIYTYDERGNLISVENDTEIFQKYEYDEKDRMIRSESKTVLGSSYISEYFYDEDGNLIEQKTPHSTTKYMVIVK